MRNTSPRRVRKGSQLTPEAATQFPFGVCAVTGRFPAGASPTRQTLQPEATGAVMEVTKWLKPLVSVSRIGDSASVQAVTRVNAEQASLKHSHQEAFSSLREADI